jgi:CBS domain-containing protein
MGYRQGFLVVGANTSVSELIRCFWSSGAEHAAIVDEAGKLVGIVSVRDVVSLAAEAFEGQGLVELSRLEGVFGINVDAVASKPPITVRSGARLEDAVCIMAERGIGFTPVVDDDGVLVGGFVEADVSDRLVGSKEPAVRYATRRLIVLEEDAPVIEALGLMAAYRVRRIPVRGRRVLLAYVNDLLYLVASGYVRGSEPLSELKLPLAATLPPTAPLGEAAFMLPRLREKAIVLVDGGEPAAIITERDLLYAYASKLAC